MSELLKDKQIKTKGNKCCEVTLSVRYILSIFLHSKKITFNLRVAVPPSPQGETEGVLLEKKGTATRMLHCIQRFYKKKIPLRTSLPKIQGNKGNQGKKRVRFASDFSSFFSNCYRIITCFVNQTNHG